MLADEKFKKKNQNLKHIKKNDLMPRNDDSIRRNDDTVPRNEDWLVMITL